jgi:D-serine deaminase-like pyridoxal phosphate-dependent protein
MNLADIQTPAVVIDLDKVDANLARAQAFIDQLGLRMRPHVKTHKLPVFARQQIALGAVGITCQKLGEAEAMADGGIEDIFLPYNILGAAKLDRLAALHDRVTLSVTADSAYTIAGYAARFEADRPLTVLVECETGMDRCGVQTAEEAVTLARQIADAPGLRFGGLMTYPPPGKGPRTNAWLADAKSKLEAAGLPPEIISVGGSPDLYKAAEMQVATEYRPGTYIYSDRMQVAWGHGTLEDCAMTVKATVVSRPRPDRAVLDCGSKALAADLSQSDGHGHLTAYPDAVITRLTEEHAVVDLSSSDARPEIGETVWVIPNHACVVSNLFDFVYLVRGADQVEKVMVTSRGALT